MDYVLYIQFVVTFFQLRKHPKFVVKEMESMYTDELKAQINLLMANLESLPVSKSGGSDSRLQMLKRYPRFV